MMNYLLNAMFTSWYSSLFSSKYDFDMNSDLTGRFTESGATLKQGNLLNVAMA